MTPVINPWIFYFIDLADDVDIFCSIFGILAFIVTIGVVFVYFGMRSDYGEEDNTVKTLKSASKLLGWLACILLLIGVVVPSKETITKMVIAQNVTYDHVETVSNTVKTVYNDIMELFASNE